MDVPVYMPRLEERFRAAGGRIEVTGQIVRSLADLMRQHPLIVNCTGLGARELCGDREMTPVRGQLVRTTNPGIDRCVADEHHPLGIAYVIARSTDCILGGTAEENVESLDINARDRQRLLEVNLSLEPRLKTATVLQDVACVRPVRSTVRLEREGHAAGAVIHNYGHGGAGFTVSWGCAEEVAGLIATVG
jgi:D-amino-acid oxidase